jgi:hypothetical protein
MQRDACDLTSSSASSSKIEPAGKLNKPSGQVNAVGASSTPLISDAVHTRVNDRIYSLP